MGSTHCSNCAWKIPKISNSQKVDPDDDTQSQEDNEQDEQCTYQGMEVDNYQMDQEDENEKEKEKDMKKGRKPADVYR